MRAGTTAGDCVLPRETYPYLHFAHPIRTISGRLRLADLHWVRVPIASRIPHTATTRKEPKDLHCATSRLALCPADIGDKACSYLRKDRLTQFQLSREAADN